MNYYKTLNIEEGASPQEIKDAYRKLAKQYHPDRNPGDREAYEKFKQVQEAYDSLQDNKNKQPSRPKPQQRRNERTGGEIEKLQSSFFGGGNVMVHLYLSKSELEKGCFKSIIYQVRDMCKICGGDGKLWRRCPACGFSRNYDSLGNKLKTHCRTCKGTKEVSSPCKGCSATGLFGVKEKTVNLQVKPNSFSGMQVNVPGGGEMLPRKNGDLRVVLIST